MDRGKSALRGSTQLAMPPEDFEVTPPEQVEIDHEQDVANAKLASLKGHPGWELIKEEFNDTIERYRSGRVLKDAVATLTLEELGRKTVTTNAVADELEKIVYTVEAAALALEDRKS